MKRMKWMNLTMALAACAFVLTACDDDDDHTLQTPEVVKNNFTAKYGEVGHVDWDIKQSNYYVADFWLDHQSLEAWYTQDGTWKMTETELGKDINNAGLPEAVKAEFQTDYAQKTVDDIDKIETAKGETFYIIEVDPDDIHIHYNADGTTVEGAPANNYYSFYLNR